jgi:hypothetical protein
MQEWYKDKPDRWERELAALEKAKILYTVDEKLKAHGLMRLQLQITLESQIANISKEVLPLKLIATFPSLYPHFRPQVFAPELSLPRHQHLFGKNLCLLPRASKFWLPQMTLAELLNEQLHKVLAAGLETNPEVIASNIEEQAEPVSDYYQAMTKASIIFDPDTFDSMPGNVDEITLLGTVKLGAYSGEEFPFRMVGMESFNTQGESLKSLPEQVQNMFSSNLSASIYRLKEHPPHGQAEQDYKWVVSKLKEQGKTLTIPSKPKDVKGKVTINSIVGLTFPEEHSPGKLAPGWIFIVNFSVQSRIGPRPVPVHGSYYAKINRVNAEELGFRMPSLRSLADKKIVVVGLGALGAPSAIELAKNGVGELRIVDGDIINAGTIIRYPVGIRFAGLPKAYAIQKFIDENYPFTKVIPYVLNIGVTEVTQDDLPSENLMIDELEKIFDGASLIYDATAEMGVNHFLAQEAKGRGIPYICVEATPGVWGGNVMRFISGITKGCWMCVQYSFEDGTFPNPPQDRSANIQTPGCGDISFIGASFELENLVAAGVRLCVSTLSDGDNCYPKILNDLGVLSLVDDHGNATFPSWKSFPIEKNPNCPYCKE